MLRTISLKRKRKKVCIQSPKNAIIIRVTNVCLHGKQTTGKLCAKINSTRFVGELIELKQSSVCESQNFSGYFFKSAGFKWTLSGETFFSPNEVSTFLFISSLARSNGVCPFRLSRARELIWQAIKVASSCDRECILRPFGMM